MPIGRRPAHSESPRVRRHPGLRPTLLALALTAATGLGACAEAPEPARRRALLIAVDGATNKVIDPMVAEGLLPNFAALGREGGRGAMRADLPLLSPRIWTSVATGKTPEKHGIEGWARTDAEGRYRLYLSTDRRVHAIWNILSDAGHRVAVVNWLNSHPPEKIRGLMISDHAVEGFIESRKALARQFIEGDADVRATNLEVAYAFPEEWTEEVRRVTAIEEPFTSVANPWTTKPGPLAIDHFMEKVFEQDSVFARLALEAESRIDPDLLMVYLPGVDRVSHFLWDAIEAPPSDDEFTLFVRELKLRELRSYYRHVDELIGKLMARFGPEDLVLLLSDHGFEIDEGGRTTGNHKSEATRDGILYVRGPGVAPGAELGALGMQDVTPTLLAWFGVPAGLDMDGVAAGYARPTGSALPEAVASHDAGPIERVSGSGSEVEPEILDQLKTLGYVD